MFVPGSAAGDARPDLPAELEEMILSATTAADLLALRAVSRWHDHGVRSSRAWGGFIRALLRSGWHRLRSEWMGIRPPAWDVCAPFLADLDAAAWHCYETKDLPGIRDPHEIVRTAQLARSIAGCARFLSRHAIPPLERETDVPSACAAAWTELIGCGMNADEGGERAYTEFYAYWTLRALLRVDRVLPSDRGALGSFVLPAGFVAPYSRRRGLSPVALIANPRCLDAHFLLSRARMPTAGDPNKRQPIGFDEIRARSAELVVARSGFYNKSGSDCSCKYVWRTRAMGAARDPAAGYAASLSDVPIVLVREMADDRNNNDRRRRPRFGGAAIEYDNRLHVTVLPPWINATAHSRICGSLTRAHDLFASLCYPAAVDSAGRRRFPWTRSRFLPQTDLTWPSLSGDDARVPRGANERALLLLHSLRLSMLVNGDVSDPWDPLDDRSGKWTVSAISTHDGVAVDAFALAPVYAAGSGFIGRDHIPVLRAIDDRPIRFRVVRSPFDA